MGAQVGNTAYKHWVKGRLLVVCHLAPPNPAPNALVVPLFAASIGKNVMKHLTNHYGVWGKGI